ncbi:MAG: alpha/beta hydrolase [Candidatus Hydrogenedentes bacterium]|nr:alpha/beta hydrolase [Candidatus Hydrogenedentota bacterium]MBI3117269.1 alpha/beta hydrolase [Candidatus Hydrogenedentota bacterium]
MTTAPPLHPTSTRVTGEGGLLLNVWDYGGGGPPILLCHCTGTFGRIWDPVARHLQGTFRMIAIDTRGQGDSAIPSSREDCAWWRSGEDVLAVIEHFDFGPGLRACGHSAGGAHLAHAELAQPGTFSRLVLIDPIIAPDHQFGAENPLAAKVRRRLNTFSHRSAARDRFAAKPPMDVWAPEALNAYVEFAFEDEPDGSITLKCPGEREAWFYELGGAPDVYERLHQITCPTLLVTGSESYVAPLTELQAARLPQCERRIIEGAGHFIPQEKPETIAQVIKDWLQ